jgi:hypothetical protein
MLDVGKEAYTLRGIGQGKPKKLAAKVATVGELRDMPAPELEALCAAREFGMTWNVVGPMHAALNEKLSPPDG